MKDLFFPSPSSLATAALIVGCILILYGCVVVMCRECSRLAQKYEGVPKKEKHRRKKVARAVIANGNIRKMK